MKKLKHWIVHKLGGIMLYELTKEEQFAYFERIAKKTAIQQVINDIMGMYPKE